VESVETEGPIVQLIFIGGFMAAQLDFLAINSVLT